MRRSEQFLLVALVLLAGLAASGADWLRFRGVNNGVSTDRAPPTKFSLAEKQNVAWQVDLPAKGASSPICVGGKVIVTASGGVRQDRIYVLCYDAQTGAELWRREFWATGRTFCHPQSANAAPTPASDGQRIYAFYSSNDLVCLDLDGNLQWYRGLAYDYPKAGNDVGMAASPLVIGETVVVQIENEGDSFAAGLNRLTGETLWRVDRDRAANWASPALLPGPAGQTGLVLLQSTTVTTAHDPVTGAEVWRYKASSSGISSPTGVPGKVILPANGLTLLEFPEGSSAPSLAWDSNQLRAQSASPVIEGDRIYVIDGAGILKCANLADGKLLWQLRLGGAHWATPVLVGGHAYCISQDGKMRVIKLEDKGELVGESEFGELIQASPAVSDGAIYARSDKHLWKIADDSATRRQAR